MAEDASLSRPISMKIGACLVTLPSYHLEFVSKEGHKAGRAPTEDNLLVFYLPDEATWKAAVERMEKAGFQSVKSFNPYWDVVGKTFEDADGYRVVFQRAAWDNANVAEKYRAKE